MTRSAYSNGRLIMYTRTRIHYGSGMCVWWYGKRKCAWWEETSGMRDAWHADIAWWLTPSERGVKECVHEIVYTRTLRDVYRYGLCAHTKAQCSVCAANRTKAECQFTQASQKTVNQRGEGGGPVRAHKGAMQRVRSKQNEGRVPVHAGESKDSQSRVTDTEKIVLRIRNRK